MAGRVGIRLAAIICSGNYLSVAHHHCADGHFVKQFRLARFSNCQTHEFNILRI